MSDPRDAPDAPAPPTPTPTPLESAQAGQAPPPDSGASDVGGGYARYVLGVLTLVYVFNFIDRQILSVLADEIKADLGLTDAQLGFLYGTVFAVFYAVFGIPLGRLADVWRRTRLIAIGLSFWSAMTALSGTARSFVPLAGYRIGVGIGEASATPAAFSLLSDWFTPALRATALAVYSSGVYIGAGIGLFLGGSIVDAWRAAYPDPALAPFGLQPWQAAFFAVGLPGLLMAVWVATLREPRRGQSEGLTERAEHPTPFDEFGRELAAVIPPLTLFSLHSRGGGKPALIANLAFALGIAALAALLIAWLGSPEQWIALGIGVYAAVSWVQGLALRDPPAFAMIFRSRALRWVSLGFPSIAFVTYGVGFWSVPYFQRVFDLSAGEAGVRIGIAAAVGGWLGVTLGGVVSDRMKRTRANARLWVGGVAIALAAPIGSALLMTDDLTVATILIWAFNVVSPMWVGPAAGAVNELVLPRMRALVSAYYLLMVTFIGLALGPYAIGQISDSFIQDGLEASEALRRAMLIGLGMLGVAAFCLLVASRHLPAEEASRLERARAAGEPDV